jgi:Rv2525c-like, glycoside hydrolase-like domain
MPVRKFRSAAARAAKCICLLFAGSIIGIPALGAADYCVTDPQIEAVDLSAPVDQGFLSQMKAIGIKTIIRYYDQEDEILPGKTLRRGEREVIAINGFKTAVVFQHRNNKLASFTALRGRQDAERSLRLAEENHQPMGSAIYFGVDGPWRNSYELMNIMAYFQEIKPRLAQAGYRVGVYGSGLMCNTLIANGLAELCWLAAPTSWPEFSNYYQTKRWRLVQLPTTQCGGRSVDFNLANGADIDYGQFGY